MANTGGIHYVTQNDGNIKWVQMSVIWAETEVLVIETYSVLIGTLDGFVIFKILDANAPVLGE